MPVNLLGEVLKDATKLGEIVLDPFLGFGSTIIAAEKTGRIGFGIEAVPKYCDNGIRRWEKMTGKTAIHVASGLTFALVGRRRCRNFITPQTDQLC
jgi:DNA modification methylase